MISIKQQQIEMHLQPHETIQLRDARQGMAIECKQGIVWVTRTGDSHDTILTPGESYLPEKGGKIVIEAMRDALICLADDSGKDRYSRLLNSN
jgi:hypothetical protein